MVWHSAGIKPRRAFELPSLALDSGIHAGMTGLESKLRIAARPRFLLTICFLLTGTPVWSTSEDAVKAAGLKFSAPCSNSRSSCTERTSRCAIYSRFSHY